MGGAKAICAPSTEAGLEPRFADSDLWTHAVQPAVQKQFEADPEISAVFTCNDDLAIAVIRTVQRMGKQVPDDVSVVGFDDIQLSQHHPAQPDDDGGRQGGNGPHEHQYAH